MKRILIIEDDLSILKGLRASLQEEHYEIISATDGDTGYEIALEEKVDLILLDLMLPGKNGQEICADLRNENVFTPIIMLTSKQEEVDKVLGLESGADDYVTKPFSIHELKARIKAIFRRANFSVPKTNSISFGKITIDFLRHETLKEGKIIHLAAREYEIMRLFVEHEGQLVTRDMLLDQVWGYDVFPTTRTVDNYILNLRKKIEDDPANPKHLLTIHGAGYKFAKE